MTKKQATAITSGPTDDSTRDTGIAVSSTDLAYSKIQRKVKKNTEFGSRESVFNGSISSPLTKLRSNDTTIPNFSRRKRVLIVYQPARHSILPEVSFNK